MARKLLLGQLRVQEINHRDGRVSYTIVQAGGAVHTRADRYLVKFESQGTDRTYAYYLVDHLRWLEHEGLTFETVQFRDLERYMGAVGAEVRGPTGVPWRVGKRPYGNSALSGAASCLKGFYLQQAALGCNQELGRQLDRHRMPTKADRSRSFLGHVSHSMPSNPLAPTRTRRRHPKMLPDGARGRLLKVVNAIRDRMVVDWLGDGGFRIGEMCGLHLSDLHLRSNAECGECRAPHAHVCHRDGLVNRSRAKTKHPWALEDGVIRGGLIKRVSPLMIHSYFEYMTCEYPPAAEHGMVLVQQHGPRRGMPWATEGARKMLRRAGSRARLGRIRPHMFRHDFANAVLDASNGNLVVARDAGGWASIQVVDEIYAHVDINDPVFEAALLTVWGEA
ncbi:tyrosine-type recombinase/integrase [Streptomyces boluensis]|uniref:Tyrosine-type recombinase/integrase n=1 Tax=Streptomyces boluensis TaxID=1775135 RepID=A0A964UP62_9ACTN|nr:tyrosine-type recombinase/integrase [Streptomyces boluensis]NBE51991.1 tyrosine-type recombinase/integrase [Streptomyces boluensis]